MKKVIVVVVVIAAVVALAQGWLTASAKEETSVASVAVERGSVALEALAVGRLEARFEVPVKTSSGGVVTRRFVALGQKVKKGDPLCEVRPVLTELQRLQAGERDEEVARLHLDHLGVRLTELSPEQAEYLGVPVEGPYKPDHYRY